MDYQQLREAYKALLERALAEYDSFSLLWSRTKGHLKENASVLEWAALLEPYLIGEIKIKQYRGLALKGGTAKQRLYRVCRESVALLAKADNVFEFSGLSAPEELTFYKDGKVAFRADAHEESQEYFNV